MSEPEARAAARPQFSFPGTPRGTETVLVVEDEDAVRRLVVSILEMSGYRVLETAGADEAIAISEQYEGPIHLLLTDLDMPVMTGRQLAQRLRASREEAKILYMSGREDFEIMGYGVLPAGTLFLPKPFTPYGLSWKVREVLDGLRSE